MIITNSEATAERGEGKSMPGARASKRSLTWLIIWLLIPAVIAGFALFRFTPEVWFWKGLPITWIGAARVPALVAQLRDPLGWALTEAAWSDAALRWRLLMPVVGHGLGIKVTHYLGLVWVGAFWMLALSGWYVWRLSGSVKRAWLAAGLAATGAPWFVATIWIGQFDVFFLVALLAFSFSRSSVVAVLACLLGPWLDERFLLALPLCAALRSAAGNRLWWQPALAVLPYLFIRSVVTFLGDGGVSYQVALQSRAFAGYLSHVPLGWWHGFRMGWVPIVAAGCACVAASMNGERRGERVALVTGAAGLVAIVFLAWDSTRSIAVLLPFLVLGVARWRWHVGYLWAALALNLLLPAAMVSASVTPRKVTNLVMPITSFLERP